MYRKKVTAGKNGRVERQSCDRGVARNNCLLPNFQVDETRR